MTVLAPYRHRTGRGGPGIDLAAIRDAVKAKSAPEASDGR